MADEKLNTSPEENPQPSLFDTGPAEAPTPEPPAPEKAPEQAAGEPPAQDAPAGAPGEVNVSYRLVIRQSYAVGNLANSLGRKEQDQRCL
ncbi:hypothetical protein [uncultured Oscillibacter sp.]|uniref:hypothetical protein n=1 Tax=uncultured Oscillibacter sp. TaxID=876091 RepID=UPI0026144016|nr:hypothetical protein [uncultured Oscillibacter sp.]